MKTKSIKSELVEIIKFYTGNAKIYNLEVKNGWLCADLGHCRFSIKNE